MKQTLMGKHDNKITRAAHIKNHTVGTSNEISFSVLDAAKNALDGGETPSKAPRFGAISLFTLPGRKKTVATPKREQGLHLPGGGFISTENGAGSPSDSLGMAKPPRPASSRGTSAASTEKAAASAASAPVAASPLPARSEKASSSWVTPADEVAAKKRARKTRKYLATAVAFCAVVAIIGSAGYWLYNNHLIYQDSLGQLNKAIALVNEADETLLLMDEQIQLLVEEGSLPMASAEQQSAINEIRAGLPDAQVHLKNALLFTNNALESLSDSVDKAAAIQLVTSIESRQTMVEPALALFDYVEQATEACSIAEDAWSVLLEADSLARVAAGYLVDPTIENLQASIAKTKESIAKFREASSLFSSAQSAYPEADFGMYQECISKRIEALNYAIASDQALIDRNLEEAVAQNDAYTQADAAAVEIAERLPRDPSEPIADVVNAETADTRKAYEDARLEASAADSFLRDYLGASA